MPELISESIMPLSGSFDAAKMAMGEPGLPKAFTWRDQEYGVIELVSAWKESSREGGRAKAEVYLRRHYYELRMSDESVWTVYFLRQSPKSGNLKKRWFLYTLDQG